MNKTNFEKATFRLLCYITEYTKEHKVPPTTLEMLMNVKGIESKTSLYRHLQVLIDKGLITKMGTKAYYFPTDILENYTLIPKDTLLSVIDILNVTNNAMLTKELYYYMNRS